MLSSIPEAGWQQQTAFDGPITDHVAPTSSVLLVDFRRLRASDQQPKYRVFVLEQGSGQHRRCRLI